MMSSQEHRENAARYYEESEVVGSVYTEERAELLARAQYHATMAVYEGMHELLGDGSRMERVMTAMMQR